MVVDDAVATQDTVTQLISAIRRGRKLVPAAASVEVVGHDYDQPGKPVCASVTRPAAHDAPVTGLVTDTRC